MIATTSAASLIAFGKRHRAALAIAVLLVFPWLMPYEALAVNILVLGLYAVGFNLLFGYTGLLSFGHAAFLGSGAYGCGIALVHFGVPWFGSILIGVLLSAFFAAIMGFLAIRTRGIYFAMVTLALSQCVYYLFYQAVNLTGGENGLRGINLSEIGILGFSVNFLNPTTKYYVILAFVAFALWLFSRLLASPFGAVLEAIRENESRARACGYDVARVKFIAFVISGAFCGLAGALKALHLSIVPIETLHYLTSGQVVMMALLGGMNTFFGPFVGAAAFLLLEDMLTTMTSHWQLVLGAVFVIFVLFFPKGIWGSALAWMVRK
ncbi:branched-chain amino acid ABC transporter permease [Ferrovibrio terrae]|uniref:Branched-chain amino acid ABC transporter permease n=1 Tax=Ferrovibrio terrae TaxID=2594003 RepID=A0A516H1E8_9PROT|nr:branched-chain amino acid ABC transporter permease [Ferrovibrio terrae]QDO97586.1 branched-chain amino acid ABC transporter permease [Ferrovibrio terrae]